MVKKISLFVSMALALLFSFQLLPNVIMYLSTPNALEYEQIWTIIVFLFSAPILVVALVVAIKSLRKRAYEKFAVWLNFSGALTICSGETERENAVRDRGAPSARKDGMHRLQHALSGSAHGERPPDRGGRDPSPRRAEEVLFRNPRPPARKSLGDRVPPGTPDRLRHHQPVHFILGGH